MRRILLNAPASSLESVRAAVDAGANEIYCGVRLKNIDHVTFNGRPNYASLNDFDELITSVNYAHDKHVKINFLLNLPYMADILGPMARQYIRSAVKAKVDSFIVADLGLILLLDKMNISIPMHIGSFATVRNNEAISFYAQFNTSRIIAPPDSTLDELHDLCLNEQGIEVEAFVHGQGCSNVNGNCNLSHSYKNQLEEFPDDPLWKEGKDRSLIAIGKRNPCMFTYTVKNTLSGEVFVDNILDSFPFCSLCSLKELSETGISAVKIEGRCQPMEYLTRVPREYRKLLDFLEKNDVDSYQKYLESLKSNSSELRIVCERKKCFYQREHSYENSLGD